MLFAGILFLAAPVWLFLLDRADTLPPTFDPLTWSLVLGVIGIALIGFSRRHSVKRALLFALGAAVILAVEIYAIAAYVATTQL